MLKTRQWILEQAGYEVLSALGFAAALEVCQTRHDFDLVLMGHSMPQKDKIALFEALKTKASLLSILRPGELPIPHATHAVEASDGPEALLEAVKRVLPV